MEDEALWGRFLAAELPHAEWTHEAHVRVAYLHVRRYTLDEAHLRMRAGIVRLNASHGLIESPERGYHETITRAWLALVAALPAEHGEDSRSVVTRHASRLTRDALLRHYSRERLLSLAARARFLEPDREPLPEPPAA